MKWYCSVNKLSLSNKYFMQTKPKKWSAMRCKLGITKGNCAPHLPCSNYPTVIRGSFYLLRRCCSLQYNMIERKLRLRKPGLYYYRNSKACVANRPNLELRLCHFSSMWPWPSYLISLNPSILCAIQGQKHILCEVTVKMQ